MCALCHSDVQNSDIINVQRVLIFAQIDQSAFISCINQTFKTAVHFKMHDST